MTVNGPEKLLYLTLGIMFLALGVIGLLIPIIPGVLFLAGAVYMLSRGSRRVKAFADGHPKLRKLQHRMNQLDAVSIVEKCQVTVLMTLEAVVVTVRKLHLGFRKLLV
jgi:uncharacterized membrane protein YbaN (DUF454 family)